MSGDRKRRSWSAGEKLRIVSGHLRDSRCVRVFSTRKCRLPRRRGTDVRGLTSDGISTSCAKIVDLPLGM